MAHTITITRVAGDQYDDADYEIGGECDSQCEVWRPCEKAWHRHPKNEDYEFSTWSTKRAPLEHQFIDGEWMVPSGECALHTAGSLSEVIEDEALPGVYAVDVNWDDWWWFALTRKSADSSNGDDRG